MEETRKKVSVEDVYAILREVFKTKSMLRFNIYIIMYKMGERGALNNFPLFMFDQGISSNQLAFWNGIIGQSLSILGSVLGGFQLSSLDTYQSKTVTLLKSYTIHRSISIFFCYTVVKYYSVNSESLYFYISIFSIIYLNLTSGLISTLTFTLMMEESRKLNKNSQITHYNYLASIEVAGKLIFASVTGFFIESFSISQAFFLFFILSLCPYFLLETRPSISEPVS